MTKETWWHRHRWEIVKETVVLPSLTLTFECSEQLAERLLAGLTVVLLRCQECGQVKKEEMLGRAKERNV